MSEKKLVVFTTPEQQETDARRCQGIEAFIEVHGRPPGDPPGYEDCATALDEWASSAEGQREIGRRNIKNWW